MLEYDVYDYLDADTTLGTLLGASASDSKIYPIRAPQGKAYPFIVYDVTSYGDDEEWKHKERITFKIVGDKYGDIRDIRDRIRTLLDLQDSIRGQITSTNYRIVWSKLVTGQDLEDIVTDPDTEEPARIIAQVYEFSFINR